MYYRIFKPIIIGILLGAALFIMPFFIIRVVIFFLIISAVFRFFIFRRWGWHRNFGPWHNPYYMDKIRRMNDDDYEKFRNKHHWDNHSYPRPEGPVTDIKIN